MITPEELTKLTEINLGTMEFTEEEAYMEFFEFEVRVAVEEGKIKIPLPIPIVFETDMKLIQKMEKEAVKILSEKGFVVKKIYPRHDATIKKLPCWYVFFIDEEE